MDTYLAGLGTGLLSTAAVSLSSSLTDMPLAGAEVVRLAFRLGILVDEVSQNLQPRQVSEAGPGDSWAYVVPDVTADEVQRELDAIHKTEVRVTHDLCIPFTNNCRNLENTRGKQDNHKCFKSDLSDCQWPTGKIKAHLS